MAGHSCGGTTFMTTAAPMQRVTIASFRSSAALGTALDDLSGAGFTVDDFCVACAPASAAALDGAFSARPDWSQSYGVLVRDLQPIFFIGEGLHAVATPNRILTHMKAGLIAPAAPDNGRPDACVVPQRLRADLVERLRSGSALLLAHASANDRHIAAQRIVLAHSADRVQGHQFAWQAAKPQR